MKGIVLKLHPLFGQLYGSTLDMVRPSPALGFAWTEMNTLSGLRTPVNPQTG